MERAETPTRARSTGRADHGDTTPVPAISGEAAERKQGDTMPENGCLPRERIAAYVLGKLDPADLEGLVAHLRACSVCAALADELELVADPLVALLRETQLSLRVRAGPDCAEALPPARQSVDGADR